MSEEIERKYLVYKDKLPILKNGTLFIQGYLSIEPHFRVRIIGNKVIIGIKNIIKDGKSRNEWEFEKKLNKEEIKSLLNLCIEKPIEKIRYNIKHKDLIWEIDEYQADNKGLITADVELPYIDYPIDFPDWINISKEITHNPKYFNTNLGKHPYCNW
ncbi:MAG: adenylate cyclase [Candidatus Buchananbacteria bacterium]|jgi:CYTH domain-containing protein